MGWRKSKHQAMLFSNQNQPVWLTPLRQRPRRLQLRLRHQHRQLQQQPQPRRRQQQQPQHWQRHWFVDILTSISF